MNTQRDRASVEATVEAVEEDDVQHTPTPWYHRQAGQKSKRGEAYDWVADSPERGKHRKIIVARDACEPADYAFIVEAVNNYDSLRAQLATARKALEEIANHPERKEATRLDESSHGVGWAFWNVQRIARAALNSGEQKQNPTAS